MIPIQYALRRRMMMAAMASIDISALSITYTGAHTDYGMVTMSDGARYRLLAFTASGTLSIEQPVNCEVCVVGGGANGANATSSSCGYGGAGAYLKNQSVSAYNGGSVVVGAAQSVSSIGGVSVNAVSNQNGGTGGGNKLTGTGDGISKYPFGDSAYSLWAGKPHCGGGGSGTESEEYEEGGGWSGYANGGTNGGNAAAFSTHSYSTATSAGGVYGAGSGSTTGIAGDASYYGSGGGGGGLAILANGRYRVGYGGSGYQGIVYMRIPEEQAA